MRKAKVFIMNGMILTIVALLMRGASLVFNIYIANRVGAETTGVFTLVMSVYLFAITVATSGISLACTRIVSEEFAKKNYLTGIKSVRTCIGFSSILGFASMFLLILCTPIICQTWLKGNITSGPIYAMALGLPLIAISSVIGGYFSAVGKSYKSAISQILEVSIKMVATLLLLHYYFKPDISISSICTFLILADVISEVFSFSLNIIMYQIDKQKYLHKRGDFIKQTKKIATISFPVAITSYIRSGLSSLKQFLIPARLEMSGLTYAMAISNYGLIHGMVMPLLLFSSVVITPFSNLLVPEFSRLLAGGNTNRMKTVCNKIFQLTFLFSIAVSSIFFFFSSELSILVYQNLSCSIWIKLLSPLVFFMYIDLIIDGLLKGINEQFGVMCCNILDLGITIGIIYFLVPNLGMTGYIASIFMSEILNFTISSIQLKRRIKYKMNWKNNFLKPILISLISYFITLLIPLPQFSFLFHTILKISIFLISYVGILFFVIIKPNKTGI